jgi:hypothetical protein
VLANPPGPVCLSGGPTGSFLRLADTNAVSINAIAFDLTDPGAWAQIIADFDFRMTPRGSNSRADGFGFTLASTAVFGTRGPVTSLSEEPNVAGSLGIGFDIHEGPGEVSRNHVSIHLDAVKIAEVDATPSLDLASGQFTHARVIVRAGAHPPDVTVTLTPCGSPSVTLIDRLPVPGLAPYESRVHLMARSGGEAALHDIDNLNVQFLDLTQGAVSFVASTIEATEASGTEAVVTLTRAGDLNDAVTVNYLTTDLTAHAGQDYAGVSGTLTFAAGEETKTLRVPVLDDAIREGDERFLVQLVNPSAHAVLGAPSEIQVVIVDDETARETGHWSDVMCWPIVATHAVALPDGRVMLWPVDDGSQGMNHGDHPHAWDPATNVLQPLTPAGYDIACSGHTLTAEGKVLVAGGHVMEAVGLSRSSLYDPLTDSWTSLPDMNAGRWYPTTTSLANADVLVVAGSIDESTVNDLPQVRSASGGAWRDLTGARLTEPDIAQYYPWMYVAPDGRVFCAGRQQQSWTLDTRGVGSWTPVAASHFGTRDYGSSVMYEPGKVLITGGNPRGAGTPTAETPTASTEVIDLTASSPRGATWRRWRTHAASSTATLLPDGTVLATGGTSALRVSTAATGAVLAAEVWAPRDRGMDHAGAMEVPRLYHSTALLAARRPCARHGGGNPPGTGGHDVNHQDAQVFSPPYLYRGPRPVITSAPSEIAYGESFLVETPQAADIAAVRWIRLSSVTHAFNENQRSNVLPFTVTRAGLFATAPRDSNLCPPGHYFLFILAADGVPSQGRVVRVTRPAAGKSAFGDHGLVMRGARPNPAREGWFVEFALPEIGPAELFVYDLTGRLVRTREVGGLGRGAHVIDMGGTSGLEPGVYLLRLEQGSHSVTAKAVVLRP